MLEWLYVVLGGVLFLPKKFFTLLKKPYLINNILKERKVVIFSETNLADILSIIILNLTIMYIWGRTSYLIQATTTTSSNKTIKKHTHSPKKYHSGTK